jgi:hypothetical protein
MTPKQTIALIKEAKALGLKSIKIGEVEVNFEGEKEVHPRTEVPELKPEDIVKPMSVMDELSTEEQLFYATPYYDELQLKKKLHQEAIKSGVNDG